MIAHRGSSEDVAEHTLAAYRKAIDDGADGVECDVRLTRDGHVVCVHDRRVNRTSTGRGIVSSLELADLERLDWSAWRDDWSDYEDPEVPDRERSGILTLDRLLEVVADAGRRVEVAIETKHPTRYAGLVERRVVEVLDRFGWAHPRLGTASPVRVMSFAPMSLRRVHALAPSVPVVLLMDRVPLRRRDGSLPPHVPVAGPSIAVLRAHPGYVRRVHSRGGAVHVWTVDRLDDVALCLELGVDAIITNRPAKVLAAVARAG